MMLSAPYAGLEDELQQMSNLNVLEEITLNIWVYIFHTSISTTPDNWSKLDVVLSSGFPYLKKLTIQVFLEFRYLHPSVKMSHSRFKAIFDEKFDWCKKNLEFKTRVKLVHL